MTLKTLKVISFICTVCIVCVYMMSDNFLKAFGISNYFAQLSTQVFTQANSGSYNNTSAPYMEELSFLTGNPVNQKRFSQKWLKILEELNLTRQSIKLVVDTDVLLSRPIFVTGISSNHFKEFEKNLVKNPNLKLSPSKPLIVYNLGLSKNEVSKLVQNPNITVVDFQFSKYPSYVKNLLEYRWKSLLMAETLLRHPSIWFIDASIYFKTSTDGELVSAVFDQIRNGTFPEHFSTVIAGHSIHATTDPRMYEYLALQQEDYKYVAECGSGSQVVYGTQDIRLNTMKWYVLCALEENCMGSSKYGLSCKFSNDRIKGFARCHRYDQSALSIILGTRYQYHLDVYVKDFSFIDVKRM